MNGARARLDITGPLDLEQELGAGEFAEGQPVPPYDSGNVILGEPWNYTPNFWRKLLSEVFYGVLFYLTVPISMGGILLVDWILREKGVDAWWLLGLEPRLLHNAVWSLQEATLGPLVLVIGMFLFNNDCMPSGMSLSTFEAYYAIIARPAGVHNWRLKTMFFFFLPILWAFFSSFATSRLLGNDFRDRLGGPVGSKEVNIGPIGGGRAQAYVMTGQEYLYNVSAGCFAKPGNKYALVLSEGENGGVIAIPSTPEVGTYYGEGKIRGARISGVPTLIVSWNAVYEQDRDIEVTDDSSQSTSAGRGDFAYKAGEVNETAGWINSTFVYNVDSKYGRIEAWATYVAVRATVEYGTSRVIGSYINKVSRFQYEVGDIDFPNRLNGKTSLAMESTVENVFISQNGAHVVNNFRPRSEGKGMSKTMRNAMETLHTAYGIRAATNQNFFDARGDAAEGEELRMSSLLVVRKVYYIVTISTISISALMGCVLIGIRPTMDGRIGQLMAACSRLSHLKKQFRVGTGTPLWQQARADDKAPFKRAYDEAVNPGYEVKEDGTTFEEISASRLGGGGTKGRVLIVSVKGRAFSRKEVSKAGLLAW